MRGRHAPFLLLLTGITVGCGSNSDSQPHPASHASRTERRAFDGAPPVIPHPRQSGQCVRCHTPEGSLTPPLGFAPANPHTATAGLSDQSRCRQCHVFQLAGRQFQPSDFQALPIATSRGARAHALAPPTVPHGQFMREDCNACHSGPSARPEIRCTHSERARCTQCHVWQHNDEPGTFVAATPIGNKPTIPP